MQMSLSTCVREGVRLAALVAAIAVVVWTMPEHPQAVAPASAEQLAANR
jgi:hypothetical protein